MPRFTVIEIVETQYEISVEANTAEEAKEIAGNAPTEDWSVYELFGMSRTEVIEEHG
jgi:hypothetical protein